MPHKKYLNNYMEHKANLLGVVRTLYKRRKYIIGIPLAAGIGTAVISLFLPNFFKSTTLFFAASPDLAKPELLFSRGGTYAARYYGNENDIDRLLTLATSHELSDHLVDSFQLYQHYKINPDLPKAKDRVRKKLFSLYEIQKDKRDVIQLSVEDKQPELAAAMANAAREKINALSMRLIKNNQYKTLETYRQNIETKQAQLRTIGELLADAREKYGIFNPYSQAELLAEQESSLRAKLNSDQARLTSYEADRSIKRDTIAYLRASISGTRSALDSLATRNRSFRSGTAEVLELEKQYAEANQRLSEDLERTKALEATYQSRIPGILLVEAAEVPVVKSRPRRSLLVIAAGAIAFFFTVIGVLLFDTYQSINWKEVLNDQ